MLKTDYLVFLISILLLSIIFAFIWNIFLNKIEIYHLLKKFKNGKSGEIKAKRYLINHGFKIISEQPSLRANMFIDNKEFSYLVRADYLVKKRGKKALVEVKTGEDAINPLSTNTRRQLFEYSHLFDIDKLYLLDADSMKMKEISFYAGKKKKAFTLFLITVILGLVIFLLPYLLKIVKIFLF